MTEPGTPKDNTISNVLASRRDLTTLATVAIVAALAIGIAAGIIVESASNHRTVLAVGAAGIIVGTLSLLLWRLWRSLGFRDEIQAVLFFDGSDGSLLKVEDYPFVREVSSIIGAVAAESKAIHADWTNHPLIEVRPPTPTHKKGTEGSWIAVSKVAVGQPAEERKPAIGFIEEVTAFVLLEELSLHLSSHFTGSPEEEVVELQRSDIPEFLLKNRVLNLLSTPIELRDVFLDAFPGSSDGPEGEIHMIFGPNGVMYRRFDLTLPKHSKIRDIGRTGFSLETNRFSLTVSIRYSGASAGFSPVFSKFYLGQDFRTTQSRTIDIEVSGRVKARALLNPAGWEYHDWLDSFRARLARRFDFKGFLHSIHWAVIEPHIYATRSRYTRAPSSRPAEVKSGTDKGAQKKRVPRKGKPIGRQAPVVDRLD